MAKTPFDAHTDPSFQILVSYYTYITCQKVRTLKFGTFYFGRLIFGHFLSPFGHISDTLLKHGKSRFTPMKNEYRLKQRL